MSPRRRSRCCWEQKRLNFVTCSSTGERWLRRRWNPIRTGAWPGGATGNRKIEQLALINHANQPRSNQRRPKAWVFFSWFISVGENIFWISGPEGPQLWFPSNPVECLNYGFRRSTAPIGAGRDQVVQVHPSCGEGGSSLAPMALEQSFDLIYKAKRNRKPRMRCV